MKVLRIEFTRDRMRVDMQLSEGDIFFTNEKIANAALRAYPTIGAHSCINSSGPSFGDVIASTSIPHLLEHMVIAEQVEASEDSSNPEFPYVGMTEWAGGAPLADHGHAESNEGAVAHMEISYSDDLDAVRALHDALENLQSIVSLQCCR